MERGNWFNLLKLVLSILHNNKVENLRYMMLEIKQAKIKLTKPNKFPACE